jgi:hypothetical protein
LFCDGANAQGHAMKHTLICTDFRPLRRNTLVGFAEIRINELHLTIRDVALNEKNGSHWAALPAKPQLDRNGAAVKDHRGKVQYVAILELDDRQTRDAFSAAVINAVLAVAPSAFDDGEVAP